MATFTLNGKEYDTEDISDDAKKELVSLQFSNQEAQRLEALLAICKTASAAYSKALQDQVENT